MTTTIRRPDGNNDMKGYWQRQQEVLAVMTTRRADGNNKEEELWQALKRLPDINNNKKAW